jgi:hypothetical protein
MKYAPGGGGTTTRYWLNALHRHGGATSGQRRIFCREGGEVEWELGDVEERRSRVERGASGGGELH